CRFVQGTESVHVAAERSATDRVRRRRLALRRVGHWEGGGVGRGCVSRGKCGPLAQPAARADHTILTHFVTFSKVSNTVLGCSALSNAFGRCSPPNAKQMTSFDPSFSNL